MQRPVTRRGVQEVTGHASGTAGGVAAQQHHQQMQQHLALESSAMSITLSDLGDSAGTLSVEASASHNTAGVLAAPILAQPCSSCNAADLQPYAWQAAEASHTHTACLTLWLIVICRCSSPSTQSQSLSTGPPACSSKAVLLHNGLEPSRPQS